MLLLLLTNSVKLSNEASPIRAHSSSHTYNNWHLKNNNNFVWVQPLLFSKNVHKKKIGRVGGRISYNAVYNDLHILWEKQIYERTAHCWKRNMYQVTSPTHLKVSITIFWDVLASFDFCLTSVCLCQIFKKAYFVEPMQSNEVPTNQQKSDSKHRCSGCHNQCTMNTSNNCCTSDDIKSSPIGGPRTLDPKIVYFGTCSEQKPDDHFWDFWWLVTRIQWAMYRGSLLPRAVC